ncbi:MAG: MFS transporter [Pyrinomonadaceae bacterium]
MTIILMPDHRSSRPIKIVLHVIFLLSGIVTVLIGQVLPILARHFSLNDLDVSYFFPAQFGGSLTGTFLTARFGKRNDFFTATLIGTLLMACGILLMNVDVFSVCLVGFIVNGVGIGLTLPSINMLIVEMSRERAGPALSILNFCWGVGAIICKPFVDAFSTETSIGWTTYLLAAPLIIAALPLISMTGGRRASAPESEDTGPTTPIWSMPIAWLIALFNFIHVGFESGMGGWLTTYTGRVDGSPVLSWVSPTLLYFSFFVIGRGVAPLLFRFFKENQMLMLGLLIVLAGMVVVMMAPTVIVLSIGAVVAGFGTSWIFPTNVARFSHTFGPTATRRAMPLFICGTLGAASSTWLIGFISNRAGDLRSGMSVLLIGVLILLVLQLSFSFRRTPAT